MYGVKRVAVIGAGVSGLTAIKACLEEGLEPVCFEQRAEVGGMWDENDTLYPDYNVKPYSSLITNISKTMTCFSDFPFPKETPPFMTAKMMQSYFVSYAEHFGLRKYINLRTKIREVSKSRDYDETGNWEITVEDSNGKQRHEIFNAVMICVGCFNKPRYPKIEGLDSFHGNVEHTYTFKTGEAYKNKNVVIIGNSLSAGDVAAATCNFAKQVYLCLGSGCTLLRRFTEKGWPNDMTVIRRIFLCPWMFSYVKKITSKVAQTALNHGAVGLDSEKPFPFSPVMINDELGIKIMSGKVKVVGRVTKMAGRGVHLDDGGTVVDDVDVVICATGYDRYFSFLDEGLLDSEKSISEKKTEWYKLIFPIHLRHRTLAMIGMVTAEGPNPPVFEMQSRFAAMILAGKTSLPSNDVMRKDINRWDAYFKAKFSRCKLQVPYLQYTEELAKEIGVTPTFWKLIWRHPRLALSCLFDTASPLQYRLVGPHSNSNAVDYCNNVYENTFSGVKHRKVPQQKPVSIYVKALVLAVLLALLSYFLKL